MVNLKERIADDIHLKKKGKKTPRRRAEVEESQQRMNKGKLEKSVDVCHVYNPRFPWDAHVSHFKSF